MILICFTSPTCGISRTSSARLIRSKEPPSRSAPARPKTLSAPQHNVEVGFHDPERAQRILDSLAGEGVTDDLVEQLLPSLLDSLSRSPDPDRALNNFHRWVTSVTSRYTHFQLLLRHPAALDIFVVVCG